MAVSTTKPRITFQYADNAAFTAGVGTEVFNIRAVPLLPESEELLTTASGNELHSITWTFDIKFEPFSTVPQASEHDRSDKIRLMNMIATKRYLKVLSITRLTGYETSGIPEAKALLENQRITYGGSISTSLEEQRAIETLSVLFKKLRPIA
jgi:hypothetical protein